MRISAINKNQFYQSNKKQSELKNNFKGNIIVPEHLSESNELLLKKIEKPLVAIVGKMPCDILVKEAVVAGNAKPVIALVEPHKNNIEGAVKLIVEEVNNKFFDEVNFEKMQETLEGIVEKSKEAKHIISQKSSSVKHYIPRTIGKIQKPYVKKSYLIK